MAGSVNKVILVGNLGADPDVRYMQNGKPVCNLRLATSESWRDRDSGERRERTEWHRVVIFNEGLCKIAEQYLKKGAKIYIEGQLQTRQYEQDGVTKYSTEVVLQGFNSALTMLDSAGGGGGNFGGGNDSQGGFGGGSQGGGSQGGGAQGGGQSGGFGGGDFDDDIPF
jgi:single-strand DNA-binding protein